MHYTLTTDVKSIFQLKFSQLSVSSGPYISNTMLHVVTIRFKLPSVNLGDYLKKKLIKFVREQYCKTTNTLMTRIGMCPLKRWNYDYVMDLLTVSYHASWKTE